METKKPAKFVKSLWANFVQLNPEQRAEVASKLGPVGSILNIAANVQQIASANNPETLNQTSNNVPTSDQKPTSKDSEDDFIEAEYVEVP